MKHKPICKKGNNSPNMCDLEEMKGKFSWEKAKKDISYFPHGKLNIAYNIIDRHTCGPDKSRVALYSDESGVTKSFTFLEMMELSNQFANVLKNTK
jgi:hypothetical protein